MQTIMVYVLACGDLCYSTIGYNSLLASESIETFKCHDHRHYIFVSVSITLIYNYAYLWATGWIICGVLVIALVQQVAIYHCVEKATSLLIITELSVLQQSLRDLAMGF